MSPRSTTDPDEPTPDQPTHSDRSDEFAHLSDRLEALETRLESKDERIASLERDRDRLEETVDELADRVADLEGETGRLESATDAALKKAGANKERVAELQSRELEKGAHLRTATVDEHVVTVPEGRLERIEKGDGAAYFRVPESADPLERGGDVSLAFGDLLPIQQLARMDDQRRRAAANALPTRLAAKLWRSRTDPSVGDDPWERGCKNVREFVTASDLKHWIRRQEPGITESYAKKLVSRTIDALLDLSKNRLAVRRRTERKNGLEYTERRVIVPADASIPGERGRAAESANARRDDSSEDRDATRSSKRDGATDSSRRTELTDSSDPETADVHG
ncbi:coiled-coil domain-containing protein [Natronorubrum daqingense]|uniref:Uncharacterized protein n=1 Tax=Natronorubrum daqingense TaxID=588898 RepID=A0A1N7FFI7_9EURY|nr:hypothetical protein [Natronorubrum daqingense]APX98399.1 hypothetical protein BB347_16970 [Natronorubrum daqingense]SIR99101.1 hypothetical protein SAMN05421809_3178 [Natronorubrum daqingense]